MYIFLMITSPKDLADLDRFFSGRLLNNHVGSLQRPSLGHCDAKPRDRVFWCTGGLPSDDSPGKIMQHIYVYLLSGCQKRGRWSIVWSFMSVCDVPLLDFFELYIYTYTYVYIYIYIIYIHVYVRFLVRERHVCWVLSAHATSSPGRRWRRPGRFKP